MSSPSFNMVKNYINEIKTNTIFTERKKYLPKTERETENSQPIIRHFDFLNYHVIMIAIFHICIGSTKLT